MAQQMTDTADDGSLRQQSLQPQHQQQQNLQNLYRPGGSGLDELRPAGLDILPSPPSPQVKDEAYWQMRHKNNVATKRCRDRKQLHGVELVEKMVELNTENFVLGAQLIIIEQQFGIRGDDVINAQQIMSMFSTDERMSETTAKRFGHHRLRCLQQQHLQLRQQRCLLRRLRQQHRQLLTAHGVFGLPRRSPDPLAPIPPPPTGHRPYADGGALELAVVPRPASGSDAATAGRPPSTAADRLTGSQLNVFCTPRRT